MCGVRAFSLRKSDPPAELSQALLLSQQQRGPVKVPSSQPAHSLKGESLGDLRGAEEAAKGSFPLKGSSGPFLL